MGKYAAHTKVPAHQSRGEIEGLLTKKYGADAFGTYHDSDKVTVAFLCGMCAINHPEGHP